MGVKKQDTITLLFLIDLQNNAAYYVPIPQMKKKINNDAFSKDIILSQIIKQAMTTHFEKKFLFASKVVAVIFC